MLSTFQERKNSVETGVLSLAGQDITEFSVTPPNAHKIIHLDLSYNLLEKAEGLRRFVGLRELVLDNNNLTDLSLPLLPFLHTLSINKNKLYDLDALLDKLVKCTPQIEFLSLLGNTLCPNELVCGDEEDYQNYRYCVINKLKHLRFLDSRPVAPAERLMSERTIKYTTVRACQQDLPHSTNPETTPLKQKLNTAQGPKFGTRKVGYVGYNSEGNKYISNQDL